MTYFFLAGLAILATGAFVAARVWMLRKINQAGKAGQRPFDYEDEMKNPYEP
ncbi:hypothetical protein [Corynebacterium phocae]|uniref:hypothetical protein n=1 Tax=Corynebacterium phocae TaxID=161895 RepID=UPI0014722C9E|nr:hypothetical protein [Corynebacterium phocae]